MVTLSERQEGFDCVALQETRLEGPDNLHRARGWADRKGLSLALAPAERTGAGPLQTSGGVGLAVRRSVGSLAVHSPALEAHKGRLVVVQIEGMIRGGFSAFQRTSGCLSVLQAW